MTIQRQPDIRGRHGLHLIAEANLAHPARTSLMAVVPLGVVDDAARDALSTALSSSNGRVLALHVHDADQGVVDTFTQDWNRWSPDITLTLLHDDGRGVSETIADYLETHPRSCRVLLVQPWSRSARRLQLEHQVEHLVNVVTCRQGPPTA